jgi:hypothetical protein
LVVSHFSFWNEGIKNRDICGLRFVVVHWICPYKDPKITAGLEGGGTLGMEFIASLQDADAGVGAFHGFHPWLFSSSPSGRVGLKKWKRPAAKAGFVGGWFSGG